MDVIGLREGQGQELLPAGRHVLVEGRKPYGVLRVLAHQHDDVHQIGSAQQGLGASIGLGGELALAPDLPTHLNNDGFPITEPLDRQPVPDDVDDTRFQANRNGFDLMQ